MPMFWVREIEYLLFRSDPSKNEARVVDVSLLCICMRLSLGEFYLPFYEFALSDESLLLCDNGQLHYHIQSKKYTPTSLFGRHY